MKKIVEDGLTVALSFNRFEWFFVKLFYLYSEVPVRRTWSRNNRFYHFF